MRASWYACSIWLYLRFPAAQGPSELASTLPQRRVLTPQGRSAGLYASPRAKSTDCRYMWSRLGTAEKQTIRPAARRPFATDPTNDQACVGSVRRRVRGFVSQGGHRNDGAIRT